MDNHHDNTFHFVLDNFDCLTNVHDFPAMLSSGIARKVKFTIITRSKENIKNCYGDYINHLVNEIKISYDEVECRVGGKKEKFAKKEKNQGVKKANISYKKTAESEIKIFDYEDYLMKINKETLKEKSIPAEKKYEVADLIKAIDTKIDELEKEVEK